MRIAWLVAANRGDVLRAGGKADHQVHFGTHDDVIGIRGQYIGIRGRESGDSIPIKDKPAVSLFVVSFWAN